MTELLNETTGELTRVDEDAIASEMSPDAEPATDPQERCEAETTVGGTLYRCALETDHDGEHAFSPAEEQPPPVEDSEKKMRQAGAKLDAENERHWKRIQEIMGDDANGLVPCELCFIKTPGYRWDAAPNDETTARVRIAIGMPDLTNFAPSATERQCDDCRGLGKVRTGSSVSKYETATCDACAGKGYTASRPRLNATEPDEGPPVESNGSAPTYDDEVRRDMFGTPETDPDFEKMPNARARPVDYWQTHRE